jgi:CheY-like chemotaxis protein
MPRVLIVEDDNVIANAMATHLRREGMEVEWSDRGDRAIKKLRFERPDLAIIDLMLPGVDGWCIIKTLRDRSDSAGAGRYERSQKPHHQASGRGAKQHSRAYSKGHMPQNVSKVIGIRGRNRELRFGEYILNSTENRKDYREDYEYLFENDKQQAGNDDVRVAAEFSRVNQPHRNQYCKRGCHRNAKRAHQDVRSPCRIEPPPQRPN